MTIIRLGLLFSAMIFFFLAQSVMGQSVSATNNQLEILVTSTRLVPELQEGSVSNGYRFRNGNLGPLGSLPLKDTPYSINITSGELIENRVVHSPTEALKTVPTVAPLMSSDGYSSMHRVMVRGFTAADQSELRDGLTDRSFTIQPVENVDRIEILNGFSSFLYGFSALGGTVNYISKKPTDTRLTTLTAGVYDNGIYFGQLDLGGPLPGGLGYRVNVYDEDGTTYSDQERQRDLVSVDLAYRLNEKSTLNLAFYHQDLDESGIATYFDNSGIGYQVPKAFDPTKQYGQPWTYNRSQKDVGSLALESQLNDIFTLRLGALYGEMWREYRYVKARLTTVNGAYTESMVDTPRNEETTDAAYVLIDAKFDTWGIAHNLTYGYTHWGFTFWRGADRTLALGPSAVQNPVYYGVAGTAGEIDRKTPTSTHNFLLGDRMDLGSDWSLLAGVNYAMTDTKYYGNYLTSSPPLPPGYSGPTSSRAETTGHDLTPSVGLVYKLVPEVSLYASYMEGVQQGGTAPTVAANAGAILPASTSEQFETGIKAEIGKSFDLTLAAFRMDKVNEYIDPSDNVYKQDGREVHQGLELFGTGRVWDRLTVVGGFTVMSAQIKKAANNPATEGAVPVNIPEQMASLHLEYQLPELRSIPGVITLCSGANYLGQRPVNIPNTHH